MRYAWIERHKWYWPVSVQCEVLGVSPSGYHQHFRRRASPEQRKRLSNDALLVHIRAIHVEVKGEYGWPRTWKELLFRGLRVGKERVRKLMALHDIKARGKVRAVKDRTAGTRALGADPLAQAESATSPRRLGNFSCENARPRAVRRGVVVAKGGIEPPTQGFSVLCSTN